MFDILISNYENTQFLVLLLLVLVTKTACAMDLGNREQNLEKHIYRFYIVIHEIHLID